MLFKWCTSLWFASRSQVTRLYSLDCWVKIVPSSRSLWSDRLQSGRLYNRHLEALQCVIRIRVGGGKSIAEIDCKYWTSASFLSLSLSLVIFAIVSFWRNLETRIHQDFEFQQETRERNASRSHSRIAFEPVHQMYFEKPINRFVLFLGS